MVQHRQRHGTTQEETRYKTGRDTVQHRQRHGTTQAGTKSDTRRPLTYNWELRLRCQRHAVPIAVTDNLAIGVIKTEIITFRFVTASYNPTANGLDDCGCALPPPPPPVPQRPHPPDPPCQPLKEKTDAAHRCPSCTITPRQKQGLSQRLSLHVQSTC